MSQRVGHCLKAMNDSRTVTADVEAKYFGARLDDLSLVSNDNPKLGRITFDEWFKTSPRR